jgi:hypothetical protein
MASQKKQKGTIAIELKPCQHLDTTRDIIFLNLPFCSDKGLHGTLCKAMTKQKSTLIKQHPSKYPRMEWGLPLPDFVIVRDFVRNTPWRNQEEKTTIQAYHKIAWQMECPSLDIDKLYMILKVMKKNKSIFRLLGSGLLLVKDPRPNATPQMKQCLASAVHFHTSFQMLINHVALRGLVNPDKQVTIDRLEDDNRDPQDSILISVWQILLKHKINHLPLWQSILQNNDGSWRGYYSNGQGCEWHKGIATDWSGCIAAHLKFHLLKQGVTEESALKLKRASCSPQAFHNAINANMKDGKVILAMQAELDDDMEDTMKRTCWVNITKGMEMSERVQYEYEARGQAHLLDPNNPEVLNFLDEQSMKLLNTQVTGGTAYTAAFSASLGDTAYMSGNKAINSQESDLFDADEDSSIDEPFDTIMDGGIITNLQYVSRSTLAGEEPWEKHIDDSKEKDVVNNAEAIDSNDNVVVRSPAKVTCKATTSLGIPHVASQGQRDLVKGLIRDWVEKRGSEELPLNLVALAERIGIEVTPANSTSPTCTYQ